LSRGSDPASHPTEPLASFRTYRQLSGWNPPPLMIRAVRAHCQFLTFLALMGDRGEAGEQGQQPSDEGDGRCPVLVIGRL